VGTNWLRDPRCVRIKLRPNTYVRNLIQFRAFCAKGVLDHSVRPRGKRSRTPLDRHWRFGLGPLLILRPCSRRGVRPALHFFDNVDPQGFSRNP